MGEGLVPPSPARHTRRCLQETCISLRSRQITSFFRADAVPSSRDQIDFTTAPALRASSHSP